MTRIPLGRSDDIRTVAERPEINLINRYFETDPTNLTDQASLLSRPGLRKWLTVGTGPIRAMYSQTGVFDNCLFVVSAAELYRVDVDESITLIGTLNTSDGFVSMAATDTPYLWLADGGNLYLYDGTTLTTATVPDDLGIRSVGVIGGYTICVVTAVPDEPLYNGRFYWIEPAENTIEALNFATAERSPDTVHEVLVFGDQFWLLGPTTTEVWYPTGSLPPFQRQQGRVFDKGTWEGTAIQIKDAVMAVGTDGNVYRITDGPAVVSPPGIAQRLREAINSQRKG